MAEGFTKREMELMKLLIVDGPSNREMARQLFMSEKTVKFHISSAMRKVGAKNRTHLALMMKEHIDGRQDLDVRAMEVRTSHWDLIRVDDMVG